MADFQVELQSPAGVPLDRMDDFLSLQYTLSESGIGALEGTWPPTHDIFLFDSYNGGDVIPDNRIVVSRRTGNTPFQVEGEAAWLVQTGAQLHDAERTTSLGADSANCLLDRRIVAYDAGSAQADKAPTPADDMMKDIVDENYGASATDAARRLTGYLSIQGDVSAGASIAKAFSRRIVINVLQELAAASANAGAYLAFDTVLSGATGLQFRTYAGQRGTDHRQPGGSPPLLIGPAYGNLQGAQITFDHRKEVTYVYAGGQGEEAARAIGTASDASRIARSPFGRREQFVDSRFVISGSADETDQLANEAEAALRAGIPRVSVAGKLQDTPGFTYGLDYAWGDYLTLQIGAFAVNARLVAVTVNIARGRDDTNGAPTQVETLNGVFRGQVAST